MVTQEAAPSLRGRFASLDQILRDAGLSDLKAELEQLAMDARRSPQRIVNAHPPDQRAQVRVDLRPTSKGAGFPTPIPAEAGSGPSHAGVGANNCDGGKLPVLAGAGSAASFPSRPLLVEPMSNVNSNGTSDSSGSKRYI